MIRAYHLVLTAAAIAATATAGGLAPRALGSANAGIWSVSTSADGKNAQKVCVRDLRQLAQWEHRDRPCAQTVLSESGSTAVVAYKCSPSDFGQSKMTLLTPRSMRIETQGISKSFPFQYTLHARRLGDCPTGRSR